MAVSARPARSSDLDREVAGVEDARAARGRPRAAGAARRRTMRARAGLGVERLGEGEGDRRPTGSRPSAPSPAGRRWRHCGASIRVARVACRPSTAASEARPAAATARRGGTAACARRARSTRRGASGVMAHDLLGVVLGAARGGAAVGGEEDGHRVPAAQEAVRDDHDARAETPRRTRQRRGRSWLRLGRRHAGRQGENRYHHQSTGRCVTWPSPSLALGGLLATLGSSRLLIRRILGLALGRRERRLLLGLRPAGGAQEAPDDLLRWPRSRAAPAPPPPGAPAALHRRPGRAGPGGTRRYRRGIIATPLPSSFPVASSSPWPPPRPSPPAPRPPPDLPSSR